jgi:hypothetical protein
MPSRRSPPLRAPRAPRAPRACTRECSPIRPRPPERDVSSAYEGVTDLARWRTRVVYRDLNGWWGALEERIVGRWPWLEDVANDDDDDEPLTMDMVYIGTKGFFGTDEGGWRPSDQGDVDAPGRQRADPVWIVEVLCRVDAAQPRGLGELGGAACRRFGFGIDLRGHRERLGLPSRRAGGDPHLAGDVWIDATGRIRRATWTTSAARRPRAPWRDLRDIDRLWHTTELSDFGLEVDIEPPTNLILDSDLAPFPVVLYEVAGELWRVKRAYDRRQPDPMPDNTDSVNLKRRKCPRRALPSNDDGTSGRRSGGEGAGPGGRARRR